MRLDLQQRTGFAGAALRVGDEHGMVKDVQGRHLGDPVHAPWARAGALSEIRDA